MCSSDLNQIMATLPSYMDSSGLLKYFPEALYGSDTLTSYFLSIASESGYTVPQEVLVKIVGGLQNFVSGKSYYAGFQYPAADLSIRKIAAMEALSRFGGFDPAYLGLIQIQPDLWPMRAVLDWASLLKREKRIPGRETFFKEALKILRSKIEWRGSVLGFKGGMKIWWLMNSMDEDANRLLLLAVEDESWKDEVGRLVRGVLARTQGGHWDLTTANAWGILAMERFSKKFEKDPVDGVSTVSFEGQKKNLKWKSAETMAAGFSWPKSKTELSLTHSGAGNPWALIEGRAALVLDAPIFKG